MCVHPHDYDFQENSSSFSSTSKVQNYYENRFCVSFSFICEYEMIYNFDHCTLFMKYPNSSVGIYSVSHLYSGDSRASVMICNNNRKFTLNKRERERAENLYESCDKFSVEERSSSFPGYKFIAALLQLYHRLY